jgi:hypothetical protein
MAHWLLPKGNLLVALRRRQCGPSLSSAGAGGGNASSGHHAKQKTSPAPPAY